MPITPSFPEAERNEFELVEQNQPVVDALLLPLLKHQE